jgi:hypothetical protein
MCGIAVLAVSTPATAAPSVSCATSGHTVDVNVSGSSTDSLAVTTSGGNYQIEIDGSAACGTVYPDSSSTYPNIQVTEASSPYVPVVFQPGTDTGIAFNGPGGATTSLDLSATSAGTTVTLNADSPSSPGVVGLSGGSDTFSGVSSFIGSSAGGTTFVAGGTGGYSFEGSGSGNKADFSVDPNPITANLSTGTVSVGPGSTDTISDISSVVGSSGGGNSFIAGTQSENFADTGSAGGDSLNFSDVPTSTSTPLTINVSGGPLEGDIANDTATVGSVTYSFTSGGANFTTFTGAATGNTTFLAGQSGGYTFDGNGSNNELDLSAVHSGATLSANGDSMASPGTVTGLEPGLAGSTTDSFAGIQSFAGYPGDAITSVNNASASHGAHLSFTVTTTGMPAPKLTKEGKLPKGVSFHSNGNGTATISGTPSAKSSGSYRLTIKARFGKGKTKVVCVQAFTLTVT